MSETKNESGCSAVLSTDWLGDGEWSVDERDIAYAEWHNKRREAILAKQQEVVDGLVADGCTDSFATRAKALYVAMKHTPGIEDREIWNAAWAAAKAPNA